MFKSVDQTSKNALVLMKMVSEYLSYKNEEIQNSLQHEILTLGQIPT